MNLGFSWFDIALIVLGAVTGGFVNGLTGFGTSLTAIPIWIHVLNPATATALAAAAGVTGQLQTLHLIRHAIVWRQVGPFILAGLAGIPIGLMALPSIDPRMFKLAVGIVIVAYCSFVLAASRFAPATAGAPVEPTAAGPADLLVALGAGIMSGIAGLSGPLPVVWSTFKPWSRDHKRALVQSFNATILFTTMVAIIAAGLVSAHFWTAFAIAVPGTLFGVRLGSWLYRRLDDRRFDRVVLGLLMAMGVMLVVSGLR